MQCVVCAVAAGVATTALCPVTSPPHCCCGAVVLTLNSGLGSPQQQQQCPPVHQPAAHINFWYEYGHTGASAVVSNGTCTELIGTC